MKKNILLLIAPLLLWLIAPGAAHAESVAEACQNRVPRFYANTSSATSFIAQEYKAVKEKGDLGFRLVYERARGDFHEYMECLFSEAETRISGASGTAVVPAYTPNVADLQDPLGACLEETALNEILTATSGEEISARVQDTYAAYREYLQALLINYQQNPELPPGSSIAESLSASSLWKSFVERELKDSLSAINASLEGLNDMRMAFVLHVRFQCLLKSLTRYRDMLEEMHLVAAVIPDLVDNASSVCPIR